MNNFKINTINEITADYFGITVEQLLSRSRMPEYSIPRQIAMACVKRILKLGPRSIGRSYNRDHSTVIFGIDRAEMDYQRKDILNEITEQAKNAFKKT